MDSISASQHSCMHSPTTMVRRLPKRLVTGAAIRPAAKVHLSNMLHLVIQYIF